MALTFHALTPDRWTDLEALFGRRGACAGCWCMYWRIPRAEYEAGKGDRNRRAFQHIVRRGPPPGILGYADGEPVGWCAIGPREWTPKLDGSRTLRRVDDRPVWSVTCFYIARAWRRQGISVRLLNAAVAHARKAGATVIEGYPSVPRKGAMPDAFSWTGLLRAFERAGFTEVARPSDSRRIVRRELRPRRHNGQG